MKKVFGKVALTLLLATSFSAAAQIPAVRVAAGAYHSTDRGTDPSQMGDALPAVDL